MSFTQLRPLFLIVGCLLLVSCISGVREPEAYTSPTGKTTVIENSREMCERACNKDYSRCMDSAAAVRDIPTAPAGMFGASADCRNDLKDCLVGCSK